MNRKYKFLSLLFSVIIITSCVGCKESYHSAYIYFELPDKPTTLDPQTASSNSELLIVKNIYEGLLRKNDSGAIVCGIAKDFSFDNLTYTFNLRDNAVWSNGDPVTANDFVFAFRRAVSPETKAPFASRLLSIVNAQSIYEGKMPADSLGITALNDFTLQIALSKNDLEFENTLTSSIAMPCKETFFNESIGKYGLDSEYIISNGSYKLTKWNKESFGIRLYSNGDYNGSFKANNAAVFLTCNDDEPVLEKLKKNSIDMAFIDSSLTDEAKSNGLKTVDYENICWVLTINSDFSENMRKSFALLIGKNVFGNDLKSGYSVADSLFPSAISKDIASNGMILYDLNTSKQIFANEIDKLPEKKFPSGIKLYYYDNTVIKPVVTDIVGHWQNNLGAYVNIESVSDTDSLISQLKEQSLSMAIFPVSADNSNSAEYLQKFGVAYNGEDLNGIQSQILKGTHIIPIAFQNTTIAYSPSISEFYTQLGNGYIDFSFVIKNE